MIEKFAHLSEQEFEKLKSAISEITVLIAGADGHIDKEETSWAKKITEIRSYKMHADLLPYYQEVGKTFANDLERLIAELPQDTEDRQTKLVGSLTDLNTVLGRLDQNTGAKLYTSFQSFAKHVAKASGGFLGFLTIDAAEKELIELPMITPIVAIQEDEEE
jgi:hypothetical protein